MECWIGFKKGGEVEKKEEVEEGRRTGRGPPQEQRAVVLLVREREREREGQWMTDFLLK